MALLNRRLTKSASYVRTTRLDEEGLTLRREGIDSITYYWTAWSTGMGPDEEWVALSFGAAVHQLSREQLGEAGMAFIRAEASGS